MRKQVLGTPDNDPKTFLLLFHEMLSLYAEGGRVGAFEKGNKKLFPLVDECGLSRVVAHGVPPELEQREDKPNP